VNVILVYSLTNFAKKLEFKYLNGIFP
jgi:hypothetical protein